MGGIQEKDVYYFASIALRGETEKPHYHTLIRRGEYACFGHPGFAVSIFSTYTDERYDALTERYIRDTIVILERDEYPHLTRRTMINCNSIHLLREEEIDIRTKKSPISDRVHEKIIRAVRKSNELGSRVKALFRGEQ